MKQNQILPWKLITAAMIAGLLLLVLVAPALAQDPTAGSALMKPPARDAAFVAELPGFQSVTTESFVRKLGLQEGLVIRQSYIEDGKIIIPPSGLYYTTRSPLSMALQGEKVLVLGKLYYFVDYGTRLDVIKDVTYKVGDCAPLGDGTKCIELSSIGTGFAGEIPGATLQILKPSGNYYGTSFPVRASSLLFSPESIAEGSDNPEGSLLPGEPTDWQVTYYGSNVATSGQSYMVVDKVTTDTLHLVDAGTGAINWLWLSAKEPVQSALGTGDTMKVGKYTVKAVEVDSAAKVVEVQILDGDKEVDSKILGPVTDEMFNYLPEDPIARSQLSLSFEDEVYVHLDVFREPFQEDKAALVGYSDLMKIENPGDWALDNRFIIRPDT